MESHRTGFPPSWKSFWDSHIPPFRRLDQYFKTVMKRQMGWSPQHCDELVTDVSGPQRNACPGTLTPLGALRLLLLFKRLQDRKNTTGGSVL
jgi:hypothetical protein